MSANDNRSLKSKEIQEQKQNMKKSEIKQKFDKREKRTKNYKNKFK